MLLFINLHHFLDIVHQNSDQKLLKKTSKFNKQWNVQGGTKKFIQGICSNFMTMKTYPKRYSTYKILTISMEKNRSMAKFDPTFFY